MPSPSAPQPSAPVNQPCANCSPNDPIKQYKVKVVVSTRAGDIPMEGLEVLLDDVAIGSTGADGISPESPLRTAPEATVKVIYENAAENLKREEFTLPITGISAEGMTQTPGEAKNFIAKVQDVFGSGGAMAGDKDFTDTYAGTSVMEDTDNPDIKLITVTVKMATLSLDVPYLSQIGTSEVVTTTAATTTNPVAVTSSHVGSVICMPTSTKMVIDYWGITENGGGDLSRNALMQETWDAHSSPATLGHKPWQDWAHLRSVAGDLAEDAHPGDYSVSSGPAGTSASIPGDYADGLVGELEEGKPIVTSTRATSFGHVMVVRGAVVKNDGEAEWLIFNDPYGNLAGSDSIYGDLDISGPVGLRGTHVGAMNDAGDVLAVQEVLQHLGHYNGAIGAPVDEADPNDPTVVAIMAFRAGDGRVDDGGGTERALNRALDANTSAGYSSGESERNVAATSNEKGHHAYYNGMSEAAGRNGAGRFRFKLQAWTLVLEPTTALTDAQIKDKLVPHQ